MILLLDTSNIRITSRNYCFEIIVDEKPRLISPKKIEAIIVGANVHFETKALMLAFENDLPIYFLDKFGAVAGISRKSNFNNASIIRRNQVYFVKDKEGLCWAKDLIYLKLENQIQNLKYFYEKYPSKTETCKKSIGEILNSINSIKFIKEFDLKSIRNKILGFEGAASRAYWNALSECLPVNYQFKNRSKNPATDPFNASLNYLYGMLYTIVETAIYSTGMDPTLGILHTDQYQKPTLAFDIIEVFRYWPDRFLFDFFNNQILEKFFFVETTDGILLGKKFKSILIPAFINFIEDKTTFRQQICSRKVHISRFSAELALILFNTKES